MFVVTRSTEHARRFAEQGLRPIVADVLQSLPALPAADAVLYAVGYDRAAGLPIREAYVSGLQAVLDALPDETGKFLYASSSGVYGQSQGETVDEDSPTEPVREGGQACLAAERALAAHRLGRHAVVLRFAGLYGPGRIPQADAIRRGEPIASPPQGRLNLIHVDDAARAVLAAAERATPPRTYVVSDGHPIERRQYYRELARLLAAPEPKFTPPAAAAPARVRAAGDKRLNNSRLLAELAIKLAYPTYQEGLAAIIAAENTTPSDG